MVEVSCFEATYLDRELMPQRPPRDQFSYIPDYAATFLGDPEANS